MRAVDWVSKMLTAKLGLPVCLCVLPPPACTRPPGRLPLFSPATVLPLEGGIEPRVCCCTVHLEDCIRVVQHHLGFACLTKRPNYDVISWKDFYALDDLGPDFSAGGGQLVGCRDVARFAQLILNKGEWPTSEGGASHDGVSTEQLVSPDYISQLLTPQYPARGFSYGCALLSFFFFTLASLLGLFVLRGAGGIGISQPPPPPPTPLPTYARTHPLPPQGY